MLERSYNKVTNLERSDMMRAPAFDGQLYLSDFRLILCCLTHVVVRKFGALYDVRHFHTDRTIKYPYMVNKFDTNYFLAHLTQRVI